MDEIVKPKWVDLLLALHRSDRFRIRGSSEDSRLVAQDDPILDNADIDPAMADELVVRLTRIGLLESNESGDFVLTERGFDRAQELALDYRQTIRRTEQKRRQRTLSRAGVFVSIGILLLGLFRLFAFVAQQIGLSDDSLVLSSVVSLGVVVYVIRTITAAEPFRRERIEGHHSGISFIDSSLPELLFEPSSSNDPVDSTSTESEDSDGKQSNRESTGENHGREVVGNQDKTDQK
jgi:hypothetical protein